ncbi:helix-turn-helix transcriptional regulator [Skermania sp. ID1734]|uniref:helix-turn-helix transcriptional regulator n=1 Tax=Skermania sp. ID1734 TaxID=2597516 RepID=UPI00163D6187|nr:helix-turn-helix transcriptional regulator [Skermania sp. ID1734]
MIAQLERFDVHAAGSLLEALGEPAHHQERWAIVAYVRGLWSLLRGDVHEALSWEARLVAEHAHFNSPDSLGYSLITAVQVDLELAAGSANAALARVATVNAASDPILLVARARAELLTGNPQAALTLVSAIAWSPSVYPRVRIDALLIVAAAQLAFGQDTEAVTSWRVACALAASSGCYLPFVFIDADQRQRLGALSGEAPSAVPAGLAVFSQSSLPVVRLTAREAEILRLLDEGMSTKEISTLLYISVNTVKSQLRNLYRKLGVQSREDAVAEAKRLQLLSE